MRWNLEFSKKAVKQLEKLDKSASKIIVSWLMKNIDGCDNPRKFGKPLSGELSNQWRYTIGDYRVLCQIQDNILIVLALSVGHRKSIYRKK